MSIFSHRSDLIELQWLNSIDVGIILHSRYSATSIISHVVNEIWKQIVSHILATSAEVAVLIDEATTERKTL